MKHFIKTGVALAALCATFVTAPLFAQEWSAAQKEVWKNVEASWALYDQGNLEGFMAYFHPDFRGWIYHAKLPNDKATVRKFVEHGMKTSKTLVTDIQPVAIQIHGNVALVYYYYAVIEEDAEGKEEVSSGRWLEILKKQGDKWVLIGDHGGRTSD